MKIRSSCSSVAVTGAPDVASMLPERSELQVSGGRPFAHRSDACGFCEVGVQEVRRLLLVWVFRVVGLQPRILVEVVAL